MKTKGFTLIELLVVIAIIAILAAIIFPVFAQARQKAYQVTCQSNLKNIATAIMLYVEDNDGKYPNATPYSTMFGWGNWETKLLPYIGNSVAMFKCPSDTRKPYPDYAPYPYGKDLSSYSYNAWLAGDMFNPSPGLNDGALASLVIQPSKIIMINETSWDDPCASSVAYPLESPCFMAGAFTHSYRHSGGDMFAFADGHVKWYQISINCSAPDQYTDPEHDISFDYHYNN